MLDQSPSVYGTHAATEEKNKLFEYILSEQALFLAPLADMLALRWAELYLTAFGRSAFFSGQRVQRIFKELTDLFIACLRTKALDAYLENLKERGRAFAKIGVPFEELIISIHLFEEICLEHLIDSNPQRAKLSDTVLALEELHNQGLAALAASYFETAKEDLKNRTLSLEDENLTLRQELESTKNSLFSVTQKELTSINLLMSGINQKLRSRVHELGRFQKIFDSLDCESHLPRLLRVASQQLLSACPANACVYFAFFDEDRKKVDLYHHETKESLECDLVGSFYFSELPQAFQGALYDESKKHAHFTSSDDIPSGILDKLKLRNQKEFLLLPIRKYRELSGFVLLSTASADFFNKWNYRLYQRLGQVVSRAVTSAIFYAKCKKQDRFATLMNQAEPDHSERSVETALDFCLGSLIDLLGAERSSFMRFDASRKELRVIAAKGHKVYPISGKTIKWGEGIAGLALKESKPIALSNIQPKNQSHLLKRLWKQKEGPSLVKSLLCVPVFDFEKPLGVVNVSTLSFHKDFDKSDIDMANQVANRIAGIVSQLSDVP